MDIKEIKNVFVPYDSPIDAIFQRTIDNIASAFAKSVDDGVMTAVVKAGFHVDKDKLEQALAQDKCRYEEAYRRGYTAGYTKREDEIIRCRDCTFLHDEGNGEYGCTIHDDLYVSADDWFCANGKRKEGDEE